MITLTGKIIAASYKGVLIISDDNTELGAGLVKVTDGVGNETPLSVSLTQVQSSSAPVDPNDLVRLQDLASIGTPTLQDVTDAGNTTTNPIVIDGTPFDASAANFQIKIGVNAASGSTQSGVFVGRNAGSGATSTFSTIIGDNAGASASGSNLTAVGRGAAISNTGNDVTAIGVSAADGNTGNEVYALGYNSAYSNTGSQVIASGSQAAQGNSGTNVVAIGKLAAYLNDKSNITAIGTFPIGTAANWFSQSISFNGQFPTAINSLNIPAGYSIYVGGVNKSAQWDASLRSDIATTKTAGALKFNNDVPLQFGTTTAWTFFYDPVDDALEFNGVSGDITINDGLTERVRIERATGNITAASFTGDGSNLTAVNADTLQGFSSGDFLLSGSFDTKDSGALRFNDNVDLQIGSDGDLNIVFDGSNTILNTLVGSGNLLFRQNGVAKLQIDMTTGGIYLGPTTNFRLYHNGADSIIGTTGNDWIFYDITNALPRVTITRTNGDIVTAGAITANNFNGVPLTTAGGGTLFLADDGTYKAGGGGGVGTLQQVTDLGNTTTNPIIINGVPFDANTANLQIKIGTDAGLGTTVAGVFVGRNAGGSSTATALTAVGDTTANGSSGSNLSAFGQRAAFLNTGNEVTAVGVNAASENGGNNVTAVGYDAANGSSGTNVTAVGSGAALSNNAANVIAIGQTSGSLNTGANSSFVGFRAGENNSGVNVNAMCNSAARDNSGSNVNAFGSGAGRSNSGTNVIGIGLNATYNNDKDNVIALGSYSVVPTAVQWFADSISFNGILPNAANTLNIPSGYSIYIGNENKSSQWDVALPLIQTISGNHSILTSDFRLNTSEIKLDGVAVSATLTLGAITPVDGGRLEINTYQSGDTLTLDASAVTIVDSENVAVAPANAIDVKSAVLIYDAGTDTFKIIGKYTV